MKPSERSPLPSFKAATGEKIRALSNQELYAILEEEDISSYLGDQSRGLNLQINEAIRRAHELETGISAAIPREDALTQAREAVRKYSGL